MQEMFSKIQLHIELGYFSLFFPPHTFLYYLSHYFIFFHETLNICWLFTCPQTCNLQIFISEKWSVLHHLKVVCMNYTHVITFRPSDPQTDGDWAIRKSWDLAGFPNTALVTQELSTLSLWCLYYIHSLSYNYVSLNQ